MESYPIWIIIDDMETYINSSCTFENAQRRILYDITVEYVYLIEDRDEFIELLKSICNYIKDSMPILDRTYSKSKIISIMTDNIFKAFGIEKIKGLKIQIDPNYDEKIVQFCEEITAYEFDDIITSKQKGISKYNFTDYKINKCISFILAAYADTMYKVSLFISYQYYLDPNTNISTIENSQDRPKNHPFSCIKVLMEPRNENIHYHYELQNIFTDSISVAKLKKVLLDDMNKHGKRIVNVHFSNLHILNCIEEHIKKLRGEERIITSDDIAETMRKRENFFDLREFYMTDVHNFGYDTIMFKNRQVTEFEKFFSVYKQEVTEDSFTQWQEYMMSFDNKICEIDYFVYEQRIQDYFNPNQQ